MAEPNQPKGAEPAEEAGKSPSKKPPSKIRQFFSRLFGFLVTLVLATVALFLIVYHGDYNLDTLVRYITYRDLELNDSGQTEAFPIQHGGQVSYKALDDDLLVVSNSGTSLYSFSGTEYLSQSALLSQPVLSVNGDYAVVYDAGGYSLQVLNNRNTALSLGTEAGQQLLSARTTSSGQLVITTTDSSVKGAVTVYDGDSYPLISFHLSSHFPMDAILSKNGKCLAILTVGQTEGLFQSNLDLYDIDEDSPYASCSLSTDTILDMGYSQSCFWLVGDHHLYVIDEDGTMTGELDYSDSYLKSYSLSDDGYATLLLGKYRASTETTLVTVDKTGTVLGSVDFDVQVLDIDSNGHYISVLHYGQLSVYTSDLSLYATVGQTGGAEQAVLRSDGSVYLIQDETAQLYIPE